MSSISARLAAAFVAVVAAASLAACAGSADSAQDGKSDPRIPESAVITGEPAGYNADDVSFADDIISGHQQAIDLLKLVPERSTNTELAALASQISAVQQPEINIMNVFLVQWKESPEFGDLERGDDAAGQGVATPGMVDAATMTKLESLRGTEFDTLWLKTMIGHQQAAVEVAKSEITNGANVDARAMAETMVSTQESQIEQMKKMLEGSKP
ncbi:hypothetical protein NGTWS0302_34660 [Mycolicibacterium cyprinidarum]|uniref:DUF305 domain-containing protein n=1 Tax=Mycolicibacterium cyprinidarum TaxID=2860311 RepID=A0ABQ4VC82_9MYCO|nr:hypothetical protein NGTWS1803_18940 [Mycolicibacterium sp. NGTWS1803]GJF13766.1 hypothetical protein NGTWS0302_34660 [Mycolicibacterium sp. NGTWS0302]GJF18354.1 hypothetical protein NGTWS1702_26200 [Mycolicibacterium sp. NGTWSNA01]